MVTVLKKIQQIFKLILRNSNGLYLKNVLFIFNLSSFRAECSEPDICRNCGAEGHEAKDCTEEAKTRVVQDKEGKDVEIYVPSEMTDAQLFDTGIHSGINFDNFDKIPVRT